MPAQAPGALDRKLQRRPSTYAAQEVHRRGLLGTPIQNHLHRLWLPTLVLEQNHQPKPSELTHRWIL